MKRNCLRWGAGFVASIALAGAAGAADAPVEIKLAKEPEMTDVRRDPTVNAVEQVMPSVVNIATSRLVEYRDVYDDIMRQFFGQPRRQAETKEQLYNLGSGVIVDENGYILTNWHVIRGGARVQVQLSDGRVYEAEKVLSTTKSDVALLKLKAKPGEKFAAIKFAKDDDLLLGETVVALGNPFGYGGSVARGILSSKNRRPTTGDEKLNVADWLQTDAAINPGNSGGPLVNMRGELIGINVATEQRGQGIGFAIPVKLVAQTLVQFFSPEAYSWWFGAPIKPGLAPLTIAEVQPGSPAAKAGLRPGMRIVEVNGETPRTVVEFKEQMLAGAEPRGTAHSVSMTVQDGAQSRKITTKLESFGALIKRRAGLTLDEITPQSAARLGLGEDNKGLLITAVDEGSPAAAAELKPGMLVTGIDGAGMSQLSDFGAAITRKADGEILPLNLLVLQRLAGGLVAVPARAELSLRAL